MVIIGKRRDIQAIPAFCYHLVPFRTASSCFTIAKILQVHGQANAFLSLIYGWNVTFGFPGFLQRCVEYTAISRSVR